MYFFANTFLATRQKIRFRAMLLVGRALKRNVRCCVNGEPREKCLIWGGTFSSRHRVIELLVGLCQFLTSYIKVESKKDRTQRERQGRRYSDKASVDAEHSVYLTSEQNIKYRVPIPTYFSSATGYKLATALLKKSDSP